MYLFFVFLIDFSKSNSPPPPDPPQIIRCAGFKWCVSKIIAQKIKKLLLLHILLSISVVSKVIMHGIIM